MIKKSLWLKRVAVVMLAAGMIVSGIGPVKAATLSDIQKEKEEAQKEKAASERQLESIQGDIEEISDEKAAVEEEIEELDSLLLDLLIEVDLMQADIVDKKIAIEQAKEDYAEAVKTEEIQKQAMAKRIKYMYEKGNESYFEILIESKDMAEAVNKVDYTERLYRYDRILLEKYQYAKQYVANKEQQLEIDLSELEEMEEDLVIQQDELNALIAEKEETVENFASQLSRAKAKASEYESQIKAQSDNLKRINREEQEKIEEEIRKKAEEEARRKAEEAAKKKAEEEEKKKAERKSETDALFEEEIAKDNPSKNGTDASIDVVKNKDAAKDTSKESSADASTETEISNEYLQYLINEYNKANGTTAVAESNAAASSSSSTGQSSGTTAKATGSGLGSNIANYGLQFVGNPYVSGGTSLTNGCDCSGFTQEVYAHFGIKIPRSSYSQSEGGTAIDYSNIQAGDIIYYGGHVAIYIGNDQIVHASTPSTGIKVSSAFYRSIITVRRYY